MNFDTLQNFLFILGAGINFLAIPAFVLGLFVGKGFSNLFSFLGTGWFFLICGSLLDLAKQ